ncbi:hypothetical protein GKZ90_0005245 [Flavobacterium sp. MC2016-06]|jgi:hypothetical protein|uniref:hypothetical protein n=1 Tax=Flavobacterium sp. MC2016-06 TaxID=2676308 RepID=UPI0012BB13D0|nr:hypothetical protein [Flavobacterium sp. MC2016-06]MBU3857541.1 hypothetical protein [Flavobacterium sp. MC2016-06]
MSKYDVFELITHLRKCPDTFLKPSSFTSSEGINSIALICDTYRTVSSKFLNKEFNIPTPDILKPIKDNHWEAIHISTWLLSHPNFINKPSIEDKLRDFWFIELGNASRYVKFKEWISDDERAEEMVRLLLYCCEIVPNGESTNEAADKLSSISSVNRHEVLKNSYEAHERIMRIKREMAEQKAREAANTYGRE